MRPVGRSFAVCIASLVAACGSGGGGSAPQASAQLGSDNAVAVSSAVLRVVLGALEAADNAGVLMQAAATSGGTLLGAFGGDAEYLWLDRDADGRVSSGDAVDALFSDYLDDTAVLSDGWLDVVCLAVAGDPAVHTTWNADGFVDVDAYAVESLGMRREFSGRLRLQMTRTPTSTYSRIGAHANFACDVATLLPGAALEFGKYDLDFTSFARGSGLLEGSAFDGVVAFEVTAPLGGFLFEAVPSRGVIEVRGATSTMTITMVDASTVRLAVDEDGDGVVDDEQLVDWTVL